MTGVKKLKHVQWQVFNYNNIIMRRILLYILYFQCGVYVSHRQWGKERKGAEHTRNLAWWSDEEETGTDDDDTRCYAPGDRQGAVVAKRRDACWGLWGPVSEGLLLKGEEAQSNTEFVLWPPIIFIPWVQLSWQTLSINPEKKEIFTKTNSWIYTVLELNVK